MKLSSNNPRRDFAIAKIEQISNFECSALQQEHSLPQILFRILIFRAKYFDLVANFLKNNYIGAIEAD